MVGREFAEMQTHPAVAADAHAQATGQTQADTRQLTITEVSRPKPARPVEQPITFHKHVEDLAAVVPPRPAGFCTVCPERPIFSALTPDWRIASAIEAPIDFSVISVPRCTSMAWMVPRSMLRFRFSQDSTAFRSAMRLSRSSVDIGGAAMPAIPGMPGMPVPGICMDPHRFLTNSSVSVTPGMAGAEGFSMVVSPWLVAASVTDK